MVGGPARALWLSVGACVLAVTLSACGATIPSSARVLPPPSGGFAPVASPVTVTTPPTTSPPTAKAHVATVSPAPLKAVSVRPPTTVDLSGASAPTALPAPTALVIPAIALNAPVVPLGRNPDGSAQVPSGFTFAGWYDLGPRPGQLGPAVILGHVDSTTGPAVFFRLRSLLPGDTLTVQDANVPVSFEVQRVVTYAKDQFPTAAVFGPTPDAELRLITCGGPFDRSIGHYEDNVVVYAVQVR